MRPKAAETANDESVRCILKDVATPRMFSRRRNIFGELLWACIKPQISLFWRLPKMSNVAFMPSPLLTEHHCGADNAAEFRQHCEVWRWKKQNKVLLCSRRVAEEGLHLAQNSWKCDRVAAELLKRINCAWQVGLLKLVNVRMYRGCVCLHLMTTLWREQLHANYLQKIAAHGEGVTSRQLLCHRIRVK